MKSWLVAALAAWLWMAPATAQARQIPTLLGVSGGVGFIAGSWQHIGVGDLNDALEANDYPTFSSDFLGLGLGGYIVRNRFLIGLEGHGFTSTSGTEKTVDHDLHLNARYGLLDLGYLLTRGPTLVFPYAGLGGGTLRLRISETGRVSFDDILENPGRSVVLTEGSFLLHLGLGLDRAIGGSGSRGGTRRAFVIGARAGYIFATNKGDWDTEVGDLDVFGGPDVGVRGPYVRIQLGRGRASR